MSSPATVHQEIASLWNARNFEGMRNMMHSGYTYTGGDGQEMQGPEAGLAIARMFAGAFPNGTLEVKKVYTQGDTAIAEMIGRGAQTGDMMGIPPTGRSVELLICNVMELRDGKIYREREYMDMMSLMVQLGVASAPGSSAHA